MGKNIQRKIHNLFHMLVRRSV